jgi:hypothetical protein
MATTVVVICHQQHSLNNGYKIQIAVGDNTNSGEDGWRGMLIYMRQPRVEHTPANTQANPPPLKRGI